MMQKQKSEDILGPKERIDTPGEFGGSQNLLFWLKLWGPERSTTKVTRRKIIPFFRSKMPATM
jgi:hypothetical protein